MKRCKKKKMKIHKRMKLVKINYKNIDVILKYIEQD